MALMGSSTQSPAEEVVRRVGELTGANLLDLPPLYDTIDPELLADFVERADDAKLHFEYVGCSITVESEGQVTVTGNRIPLTPPLTTEPVAYEPVSSSGTPVRSSPSRRIRTTNATPPRFLSGLQRDRVSFTTE